MGWRASADGRARVIWRRPKLLDYTTDRKEMLYRSGDIFNWLADGKLKVRCVRNCMYVVGGCTGRVGEACDRKYG